MTTKAKEKLDARTRKLIEGKNFAHVATLNADGSPQVTAMWVDHDGSNILLNTAVGRVKDRNIKRDARVAMDIVETSNPYDGIFVLGVAIGTIDGAEAVKHANKLNMKYFGKPVFKLARGEQRVVYKIKPSKIGEL